MTTATTSTTHTTTTSTTAMTSSTTPTTTTTTSSTTTTMTTTTTTTTTTPSYLKHEFYNYTSINLYRIFDVAPLGNFLYLTDNYNYYLIKSHLNGTLISYRTVSNIQYLDVSNSSIYAVAVSGFIYKFDLNLAILLTISTCSGILTPCFATPEGISYDLVTNRVYVADSTSRAVHIFDTNLIQVDYVSLYPSISVLSSTNYAVSPYMVNGLLYVTTNMNKIYVFKNKVLINTYSNICKTNTMLYDLAVLSNIFLAGCNTDYSVVGYFYNGTYAGVNIATVKPPICVAVDQTLRVIVGTRLPFPGVEVIN